ncbi:hypothetical protein ABID08_001201 [Rhizobium binae]|uniref:Uncharacterized protein n=1 Tax=Rhizobium binae TaxID=1138190 RepID=A0ABV2MBM3_9HYPH
MTEVSWCPLIRRAGAMKAWERLHRRNANPTLPQPQASIE